MRWELLVEIIFSAVLALAVTGPIDCAAAGETAEDCTDCHADVMHQSPVHADVSCTGCHNNLDGYPHPDAAIEEPHGIAQCAPCHGKVVDESSVHAALSCLDCHQPAHEIEPPSQSVCRDCHEAGEQLAASIHAGIASCHDCHGSTHEIIGHTDPASPTSPIHQFETCSQCHSGPGDPIGCYLTSSHSRALLQKGLINAPACSSCHTSHSVLPASDPRSSLWHERAPRTCGTCHRFVLHAWANQSAHGALWQAGDDRGPVCTTCHQSHQPHRFSEPGVLLKTPESCGGCHEEEYLSYRDSFHGKATDLGFLTAAICSDCHTPHENLPANDSRSSIHVDRLPNTCGHCHEQATASFVSFDPHLDPTDKNANRPVYFVWLFMTGLLIAVFGGFGLHDLLWLQRSLVAYWRGEFASRPVGTGPHIRRFSAVNVRVHVVVIITFLLLAATGLPLKYHWTDWAGTVTMAFGGIEIMRFLHRVAAIFTFGYAIFHLGHLFYRALIQGERGQFWGWKSLVPRPADLADLWHNLRYFLYTGPRPRLDRWAYWEKFDYFAVFWGIPIIGISGLLLWFPTFFTNWLPGWTLNAAMIVHSDEALLAVGFIFLFHFFHTHLRPESFPFDPVIFTGRMPLERFKEERPLEYERLLESGKLNARLVDPPSKSHLQRARVLGLTAVTVGLLLVIAIFWSLLVH